MANHEESTNVSRHGAWIRLLYIILYAVILNIAEGVTFILTVLQFVFHLFTGRPHARLSALGGSLAAFVREVVAFLAYHTDELPFPFGQWPSVEAPPKSKEPGQTE
jgi:hypothetical protein